jgi:hypothetical protein
MGFALAGRGMNRSPQSGSPQSGNEKQEGGFAKR